MYHKCVQTANQVKELTVFWPWCTGKHCRRNQSEYPFSDNKLDLFANKYPLPPEPPAKNSFFSCCPSLLPPLPVEESEKEKLSPGSGTQGLGEFPLILKQKALENAIL